MQQSNQFIINGFFLVPPDSDLRVLAPFVPGPPAAPGQNHEAAVFGFAFHPEKNYDQVSGKRRVSAPQTAIWWEHAQVCSSIAPGPCCLGWLLEFLSPFRCPCTKLVVHGADLSALVQGIICSQLLCALNCACSRDGGWCQGPDFSVSKVHSDGPRANALLDELYSPRFALKVWKSVKHRTHAWNCHPKLDFHFCFCFSCRSTSTSSAA